MEEGRGVHAVGDGAANEGEPVEDHRRLIGLLKEDLVGDVEHNRQRDEGEEANRHLKAGALAAELLDERVARRILENAHGGGGDQIRIWTRNLVWC